MCDAKKGIGDRSIGDVIAEIKMTMMAFKGTFILLEGISDIKFWKYYLNEKSEPVNCGGKNISIPVFDEILKKSIVTAIAIVDDDHDHFLGVTYKIPGLITTDTHDLETFLLSSNALDKILLERGDEKKINEYYKIHGKTVRNALLDNASYFGKLRLINTIQRFNISFEKKMSPWKYIDEKTWVLDINYLLLDFSRLAGKSVKDIKTLMEQCSAAPIWKLNQGHDMIDILSIGLRQVLGNVSLSPNEICIALRLAYHENDLIKTNLYSEIKAWEKTRKINILRI
jgi:Protein of unknown function (DUF4435)